MIDKENNKYFDKALSDFAYDMACGAQIRHLTDLGYTVPQIMEELDISVPYGRIQKTVTEHLCKTGILLLRKPDSANSVKTEFVREYDSYGRASFRQVVVEKIDTTEIHWKEHSYEPALEGGLLSFLNRKTEENGENFSYISCDFGLDEPKTTEAMAALKTHQQEYIQGILWEKSRMYHRLTPRMREIVSRLYEQGLYKGECYFKRTGDYIIL